MKNNLIKSIISSDFLFFNNNTKIKNPIYKFKLKNKKYNIINVLTCIQSLKQIIRLFQYDSEHLNSNIQIISKNTLFVSIINYFSQKYCDNIILGTSKLNTKVKKSIIINIDYKNQIPAIIKRTFANSFFNHISININQTNNIFGEYKLISKIDTYNKLIFILIFFFFIKKQIKKNLCVLN